MTDAPHDDPFAGVPENPDFHNVTDLAGNSRIAGIAPERLGSAPAVQPYPVEALGPFLCQIAHHIQGMTGADYRLVCQSLLAHANLATQGIVDVRRDAGSTLPTSLALMSIAKSGDGKSECDRHAGRAFGVVESEQWDDYQAAMDEWEMANDCYERDRAAVKNAKTTVKRMEAKAYLGDRPLRPLSPIRRVNSATTEGLVSKLVNSIPSRGLFTDEAAIMWGGYSAREAKNALLGTLTKLWDGEGVTSETKGDDSTTRIPGRRFAIHMQGQPEIMHPLLMDRVATGQGLLPRCLWVGPKSWIGDIRTPTASQLQARDDLCDTIARLLGAGLETYQDGSDRILAPRVLDLEPDARALSLAYTNHMRHAANDGQQYGEVRGYAIRSGEQALRIMATLALFNRFASGSSQNALFSPLTALEAQQGIDLAAFYLDEVTRLRAEQLGDQSDRMALDWLEKVKRQFGTDLFTKSDAYRFAPHRLRPNGSAQNRMDVKQEREGVWSVLISTRNLLPCGPQEVGGAVRSESYSINLSGEG